MIISGFASCTVSQKDVRLLWECTARLRWAWEVVGLLLGACLFFDGWRGEFWWSDRQKNSRTPIYLGSQGTTVMLSDPLYITPANELVTQITGLYNADVMLHWTHRYYTTCIILLSVFVIVIFCHLTCAINFSTVSITHVYTLEFC
jgi:hypothetical protein